MNYEDKKFGTILKQSDKGEYLDQEMFNGFLKRKTTGIISNNLILKKEKELIKIKKLGHRSSDSIGPDGKSKDATKELRERRNFIEMAIIQDRTSLFE